MQEKKNLLNAVKKVKWKHYWIYLALTVFLIVTLCMGNISRVSLYMYEKIAIAIILAVSLSFVVGFLGELSLGHAGFMCIGAYMGGKLSAVITASIGKGVAEIPVMILSILIGGLFAALAGVIIGLPALRLKGDYLAIVTLAFGEIVRVVFQNSSKESFGGAFGLPTPRYSYKTFYIIAFIVAIITIAIYQNIIRSKHGRAVTAIRDNEIAARATGVHVTWYKLMAFAVSAFFAGVAGVLYSYSQAEVLSTHFDYNYSIEILVMVVFGGMGSLNGSVIAAVAITFLNEKLSTVLTGDFAVLQKVIYSLILILIVIYTNAPGLRTFREKYNLNKLKNWIFRGKRHDPSEDRNDDGAWDRIPTKITMDEVLSVDVKPSESVIDPDKGDTK